jgi:hypothetical protein
MSSLSFYQMFDYGLISFLFKFLKMFEGPKNMNY